MPTVVDIPIGDHDRLFINDLLGDLPPCIEVNHIVRLAINRVLNIMDIDQIYTTLFDDISLAYTIEDNHGTIMVMNQTNLTIELLVELSEILRSLMSLYDWSGVASIYTATMSETSIIIVGNYS